MIVPVMKTRSLKRLRSTAGAGAVSSRTTNAARLNAAVAHAAQMRRDSNQSLRLPSSRKYCSAASPTAIRPMPHQSTFFRCRAASDWLAVRICGSSCTNVDTITRPTAPIGRLM